MVQQKKKKFRHFWRDAFIVAALLLGLNLFLVKKLEHYLRKELVERTTKATDGFYRLGFDDLSVSFFKGELTLRGVRLAPDSAVFQAWSRIDSLPDTYVRAAIGEIGFKGLNLTWRWNFKQLDFYTFAVKDPRIEVFSRQSPEPDEQPAKQVRGKTLYELISPYIDVLSVHELDLENADLSYQVDDPSTPIAYTLHKASFHGYGFLLDSTSSESGKLLYLDHFDFKTIQPQILLANHDFRLTADSISLSTLDSVVYLGNIRIIPQEEIWADTRKRPDHVLSASVQRVESQGIAFQRKKGLNYLTARSFEITGPRLNAFHQVSPGDNEAAGKTKGKTRKNGGSLAGDSLVRALSLYDVIAPVLHRVAIEEVGIRNARLHYAQAVPDSVETYRVDHFDFTGDGFLIDSLSVEKQRFGFFRNIAFEANDMQANLTSRNHDLSVGRLALNTEAGYLYVEKIDLQPRSTRSRRDYLTARVDTIRIDSLQYEKGVSAGLFCITAPRVQYVKAPSPAVKKGSGSRHGNQVEVDNVLNPLFRYLTIGRIEVRDASVSLTDRGEKGQPVYRLDDFNCFATHFRVDRQTGSQDGLFFAYDDFGFDFRNFANKLPGTDYRLAIRSGGLSTLAGTGRLNGVRLTSSQGGKGGAPVDSLQVTVPSVDVQGIRLATSRSLRSWKVAAIRVKNPDMRMKGANRNTIHSAIGQIELKSIAYTPSLFQVGEINLSAPVLDLVFPQPPVSEPVVIKDTVTKVVMLASPASGEMAAVESALTDTILSATVLAVEPLAGVDSLAGKKGRPEGEKVRSDSEKGRSAGGKSGSESGPPLDWYQKAGQYASRITLNKLHVEEGVVRYAWPSSSPVLSESHESRLSLDLSGLAISPEQREIAFDTIRFQGDDLEFPLNDGFYALKMARLTFDNDRLEIDSVHLVSPYPKLEFAYYQPHHKDWFDVAARSLVLDGIDRKALLSESLLQARELQVDDILLQNFKNKQIPITPHIVPMLYTVIQQAPLKFSISDARIRHFDVIYEELAKKGTQLGRLIFTDMNGHVSGLTNIPTAFDQYIRLEATGKMMGTGPFHAVWQLPVDSLNDRFLLQAHLDSLDLTTLNQIVTPLASAEVKSGTAYDIRFHMDAGSPGGIIDLAVPYRGLKVALLKKKESELSDRAFLSTLANWILKHDNPSYPDREGSQLRVVNRYVERDPYHSTFNYLWQLLKPALIETVGVTRTEQKIAKGVGGFFAKIKKFFSFGKKKKTEELSSDMFILTEEEISPEIK